MKTIQIAVSVATLSLALTGCQKSAENLSSTHEAQGAMSCAGDLEPVAATDLEIQGSSQAEKGRPVVLRLSQDLSCSSSQNVTWKTGQGEDAAASGSKLQAIYQDAGQYVVSAKVEGPNAQTSGELVHKTLVLAAAPEISGPQVGLSFSPLSFELAVPSGLVLTSAEWSFGDGSALVSSLGKVEHTWESTGTFTVTVVARDSAMQSWTLKQELMIIEYQDGLECADQAAVSMPSEGYVGTAVPMSIYIPSCLAPFVKRVEWDFKDATARQSGLAVQHTYGVIGDYRPTAHVFTIFSTSAPAFSISRDLRILAARPTPTPTPNPENPLACPASGQTREKQGESYTKEVACGVDGKKTQTYRDRIKEECRDQEGDLLWTVTTRTAELQSETGCGGQSCTLPDGSKLADGASRILYSTQTPMGACSSVAETRQCSNGVLLGSTTHTQLTCSNGCGAFGSHGTKKSAVVIGEVRVPVTCAFGEDGVTSIYHQVADQTCVDGQIATSDIRQGVIKTPGVCPTYAWTATDTWTACDAACGGKQSRMYECRDDKGQAAPAARCTQAMPTEERICDGDPESVRRVETSIAQEEGPSTAMCPAKQIGVIINRRDVTTTKVFACINHSVQLEREEKKNGPWIEEKYCRDYVSYRCSHDSLSNTQAQGRYKWMLKCQNEVPVIKEFLAKFDDVQVKSGGTKFSIEVQGRGLYPTFMDRATTPEKVWKAPTSDKGSCQVPATAYIAAVCVSSCATPEQQLMAEIEEERKVKYTSFLDALSKNRARVATLRSDSSLRAPKLTLTSVDQWVTELVDSQHVILEFRMKSGRGLRVTTNHPILTSAGTMKPAQDFRVGESLVQVGGALDAILSITRVEHVGKVYNLFVKTSDPLQNIVVTGGYLNGTAYYQNEGTTHLNRDLFRGRLIEGAFGK